MCAQPIFRHSHWVEPKLVAEARFVEWTRDQHVRHPSFAGLAASVARASEVPGRSPGIGGARGPRMAPTRSRGGGGAGLVLRGLAPPSVPQRSRRWLWSVCQIVQGSVGSKIPSAPARRRSCIGASAARRSRSPSSSAKAPPRPAHHRPGSEQRNSGMPTTGGRSTGAVIGYYRPMGRLLMRLRVDSIRKSRRFCRSSLVSPESSSSLAFSS